MTTTTTPVIVNGVLGKREVTTYVDPYPGLKGTDRAPVECGYCTNGVYTAPSGYHWENGRGDTTWCFRCNGSNRRYRSVARLRAEAKRDAYAAEFAAEIAAQRAADEAAANAAIAAARFESAWNEAHAEQARRAALVQGFLGEVGDKITATGTVRVAKYISAPAYNRSASMFVIVELGTGQVVKIFGSSASLFSLDRGYRVTITGKVKAHEAYNGQDQTVLSHAKAEILDEDAA